MHVELCRGAGNEPDESDRYFEAAIGDVLRTVRERRLPWPVGFVLVVTVEPKGDGRPTLMAALTTPDVAAAMPVLTESDQATVLSELPPTERRIVFHRRHGPDGMLSDLYISHVLLGGMSKGGEA
jgi:hypothetical protein